MRVSMMSDAVQWLRYSKVLMVPVQASFSARDEAQIHVLIAIRIKICPIKSVSFCARDAGRSRGVAARCASMATVLRRPVVIRRSRIIEDRQLWPTHRESSRRKGTSVHARRTCCCFRFFLQNPRERRRGISPLIPGRCQLTCCSWEVHVL